MATSRKVAGPGRDGSLNSETKRTRAEEKAAAKKAALIAGFVGSDTPEEVKERIAALVSNESEGREVARAANDAINAAERQRRAHGEKPKGVYGRYRSAITELERTKKNLRRLVKLGLLEDRVGLLPLPKRTPKVIEGEINSAGREANAAIQWIEDAAYGRVG